MNLFFWLPVLLITGFVVLGLMFAFIVACDHV